MKGDAPNPFSHQTPVRAFAVLFAMLAASPVTAQNTLRACYVPNTGVVYRIGVEDTADECRNDRHVEFSWTDGAGAIREGQAAAGDLGGTYPNPVVSQLQGRAVSSSAPADGQVLTWNAEGSEWRPATLVSPQAGALDVILVTSGPQQAQTNNTNEITEASASALCPQGRAPLTGGYSAFAQTQHRAELVSRVLITANLPVGNYGWVAVAHHPDPSFTDWSLTAHVVCVALTGGGLP